MSISGFVERKFKIFGLEIVRLVPIHEVVQQENTVVTNTAQVQDENAAPPPTDQNPSRLFDDKELLGITVTGIGEHYIDVQCGCTSPKYGDFVAILRISTNGTLQISCRCFPGCTVAKISPSAFEKHCGLRAPSNWRSRVWVSFDDGTKKPLGKTKLLKYYKGSASDPSSKIRPRKAMHRDEFITCAACGKERRFSRRTATQCWKFHKAEQAEYSQVWTCSDYPYAKLSCLDEEERVTKKKLRGCPGRATCRGCTACVCVGCAMCRFHECPCRACEDFIRYSEPLGAAPSTRMLVA